MDTPSIPATYYDGRRSASCAVHLTVTGDRLVIAGPGVHRTEPVDRLVLQVAAAPATSTIALADGARCVVATELTVGLPMRRIDAAGPAATTRGHAWWSLPLTAVVLALSLWWGYREGLPVAAGWIAHRMPDTVAQSLGDATLASLDGAALAPSTTPAARQQAIAEAFARLPIPPDVRTRLEFRAGPGIGPNALALPSGVVIVTDELVSLAKNDDELIGVLAHEVGHVAGRHGLRAIVQQSALSAAIAWVAGDAHSLAAAAPAALLSARYSQAFERQADEFAASLLRATGRSPASLANLLERLAGSAGPGPEGPLSRYLSSHPPTGDRIAALRSRP